MPRVDIDLASDSSSDIGWINVNDGDNQLTEIEVCRPFDEEATAPDLVLTIPKGAHRIKLWKDEEGTQPISFNNATFTSGGNRFTLADFGGNSRLSLYVEGIEASDELHDVEIMLSAAEDTYCMDLLTLTVVKIDLIEESLEYEYDDRNCEKERTPGAFIAINADDDSGTAPDYGQPMDDDRLEDEREGSDPHYYDVRRLKIEVEPAEAMQWGTLKLKAWQSDQFNVYRLKDDEWSKFDGHNFEITVFDLNEEQYYYEGKAGGTSDIMLQYQPAPGGPWFLDKIVATVIAPDLDVDADNDGTVEPQDSTEDSIENQAPSIIVQLQPDCDAPVHPENNGTWQRLIDNWNSYAELVVSNTAPQDPTGIPLSYTIDFPDEDVRVYAKIGATYAEIAPGAEIDFGGEYRLEGKDHGTYTVTLKALRNGLEMEAASDYVKVSILTFEVEAPLAVMLNDDNDDDNVYPDPAPAGHRPFEPIWDMDETGYNSGETDLRLVFFNCSGPENMQGTVELKVTAGADRIRLWPASNKGPAEDIITVPPTGINYDVGDLPVYFYVEGVDTGLVLMELEYTVGSKSFQDTFGFNVVTLVERVAGTTPEVRRVINHYNSDIDFEVVGGLSTWEYRWDLNGDSVRGGPGDDFEDPLGGDGYVGDSQRTVSYGTGPDTATRVTLPAAHANHRQVYDVSVDVADDLILHKTIRVALNDYYGTGLTGTTTPTKEAEVSAAFPTWSGTHPINFLGSPWSYTHRIWYDSTAGTANGVTHAKADSATGFVNEVNGVRLFEHIWATGQMEEDMLSSGNHEERHLHQYAAVRDAIPPTTNVWYLLNDEFNFPTVDFVRFQESEAHLSELQDTTVGWWHAISSSQNDLEMFHGHYEIAVGLVNPGGRTWTVPNARDEARALLQQLYQAIPADFEYMKRAGYNYHVRPPQ